MRFRLFRLVIPAICLLLAGCGTVTNPGSQAPAQGYVEFCPIGHFGGPIDIYEVTNEGWSTKRVGRAGYTTKNAKVKAAFPPGQHTFSITLGTAHQPLTVNVLAGQIIPVHIQISDHQEEVEYHQRRTIVSHKFRFRVIPQPPVPVKRSNS